MWCSAAHCTTRLRTGHIIRIMGAKHNSGVVCENVDGKIECDSEREHSESGNHEGC